MPTVSDASSNTGSTEPVDVIFLLHTIAYGGIESVLLNWIDAFDPRRYRIHMVCFANPGETEQPFVEAAQKRGVLVRKIPWSRRKPLIKASRALATIIRETDTRILHAHGWYADFVAAITQYLTPVRTITTSYVWHDYDWKRNLIQLVDQYAIRFFDQITAHCEFTRRGSIQRGIAADKVITLPCGYAGKPVTLAAAERALRRREMGVSEEEIVLINVARFYPEKTHDALLRIFRMVLESVPNLRLWLVGTGPLEQDIRNQATNLGVQDRVRLCGFVEDLPRLLALADIQVHPADIEGVPLAVLAGMAAALPVIASAVGGLPEILDHGKNGVLIPPRADRTFAEQLCGLLQNPQQCQALGQRALHFIENDYSLPTAVAKVAETYDTLIAKV